MGDFFTVTRGAPWAQNWNPRPFVLSKQHKMSRITIRTYTEGQEGRNIFGFSIRPANTGLARSLHAKISKNMAEQLQERQFRNWEAKIAKATAAKRHTDAIRLWISEERKNTNKMRPLDKRHSLETNKAALKEQRRQLIERVSSQTVHAVYESYLAETNFEDAIGIFLDTLDAKQNTWSSNRMQKSLKKVILAMAASPHHLSEYPSIKRNLIELRSHIKRIRNDSEDNDETSQIFERAVEITKNRNDIESAYMFLDEIIYHEMPVENELTKNFLEDRKRSSSATPPHFKGDSKDHSLNSKIHPSPSSKDKQEQQTLKIFQGQPDTIYASDILEGQASKQKNQTKLNLKSQPL